MVVVFYKPFRLWEHSLTIQCDIILQYQPAFDLQLANFTENQPGDIDLNDLDRQQENSTDEAESDPEYSEEVPIVIEETFPDLEDETFSDNDSILELVEDDQFQLSNEFSTHVMLLSRIIFKLTTDQIYSFYETYLLHKLVIPFLNNIRKITVLHETNAGQFCNFNTSELSSEVLRLLFFFHLFLAEG